MKTTQIVIILLFTNFKVTAQDSLKLRDTLTLIEMANGYYMEQDYLGAAKLFEEAYKADTNNIELASKSANCLYLAGNTMQAKNYLNELLDKTSDTFTCYKVYSKIYETEGNMPMAIKAYRYLIYKDTLSLNFRKNLARIYLNNRLFTDAKREYENIIYQNQDDLNSYISLAETYINLKDNSMAGMIIDRVIERDSMNINARKLRARILYDIKAYKEVVADLSFINERVDLTEYYYNMLGVSYMYIDSFDLAENFLRKSFSVDDYKEYGYYYIATMAEKRGDTGTAIYNYESAIDEGISDFVDIYYKRLGEMYIEKNRYDEAITSFEKALSFREKPEYVYLLALSHDYKEDGVKAISWYKKYCEITASIEGRYLAKSKERIAYLEDYLSKKKLP